MIRRPFTLLLALSFTACAQQAKPPIATTRAPISSHWPQKVFAPYMYTGQNDNFKLTDCDDACGLKYYTLAFIIAKQDPAPAATAPATTSAPAPARRSRPSMVYGKIPAWFGRHPMAENFYKDQIDAIRARGGDVIISFGGADGKEMANVIDNESDLEAAYQSVIDTYQFSWLDFDVEGNNLDKGKKDSERRNTVLANLQKKNPGLIISYTLPVDPDGISQASQNVLTDAVKKGVKLHSANLMVMYFGNKFIHKGKSEGELGIDSAKTAYAEIQKIDPAIQIGLCPAIGNNGSATEIFNLDDAQTLLAFAQQTPWICSLHYWSINGDSGRRRRRRNNTSQPATQSAATAPAPNPPWAFAKIFNTFTTLN